MKKIISILFLAVLLISCNDDSKPREVGPVHETVKTQLSLESIVSNFAGSEAYVSAKKSMNDDSIKAALVILFDQQKILTYFERLGDVDRHVTADFRNPLARMNDLRSVEALDRAAFRSECRQLSEAVKNMKISGVIGDKPTITQLDNLSKLLKTLFPEKEVQSN